ncbi:toxin-antitoxin system HicB family antitoxin [Candidatus Nitrosocosmicus sp. T]
MSKYEDIKDHESRKTSTMTFRLEDEILNTLKTESKKHQISLNTFVNQILKRYVEWGMYEPKVGMIPIAKPIVVELFNRMNEDEIFKMAQDVGKNVVYDISLFMKNRMDIESFISWFEARMKSSLIEMNHSDQNGTHIYTLKHDLGRNWSLYHKIILELMFHEIFGKSVNIEISNTTIRFKFED